MVDFLIFPGDWLETILRQSRSRRYRQDGHGLSRCCWSHSHTGHRFVRWWTTGQRRARVGCYREINSFCYFSEIIHQNQDISSWKLFYFALTVLKFSQFNLLDIFPGMFCDESYDEPFAIPPRNWTPNPAFSAAWLDKSSMVLVAHFPKSRKILQA